MSITPCKTTLPSFEELRVVVIKKLSAALSYFERRQFEERVDLDSLRLQGSDPLSLAVISPSSTFHTLPTIQPSPMEIDQAEISDDIDDACMEELHLDIDEHHPPQPLSPIPALTQQQEHVPVIVIKNPQKRVVIDEWEAGFRCSVVDHRYGPYNEKFVDEHLIVDESDNDMDNDTPKPSPQSQSGVHTPQEQQSNSPSLVSPIPIAPINPKVAWITECISDTAALEARNSRIVKRISSLQKQGRCIPSERLPLCPDPPRTLTTWDHVLRQVESVAEDFAREREAKMEQSRTLAHLAHEAVRLCSLKKPRVMLPPLSQNLEACLETDSHDNHQFDECIKTKCLNSISLIHSFPGNEQLPLSPPLLFKETLPQLYNEIIQCILTAFSQRINLILDTHADRFAICVGLLSYCCGEKRKLGPFSYCL